jgi:hypothetical protein
MTKSVPTQRAPDGWESPRFQAGFWLEAGSVKTALSRPAHPRVTQPVSRLRLHKGHCYAEEIPTTVFLIRSSDTGSL